MSEDRSALQRFEDLLGRLFRVSKQELDGALEAEKGDPVAEEEAAD